MTMVQLKAHRQSYYKTCKPTSHCNFKIGFVATEVKRVFASEVTSLARSHCQNFTYYPRALLHVKSIQPLARKSARAVVARSELCSKDDEGAQQTANSSSRQ